MEQSIGFIAAILTTISFVPQAYRTIRTRNTEGISLGMYALFTAGILCWLVYGLMIDELPIILANSVTLLLSGSILLLKIKHG